jgi:uncharacterized protein involved in type VI secretion and phage assembly
MKAFAKIIVDVDGARLPAEAFAALAEVRVHQRLSQPTACELTFADPVGALRNAEGIKPGTALRVGILDQDTLLFEGEVTAVEYAYGSARECKVVVRAYDGLHRLRKRQPLRAHVQVTPAELASEMAVDLGIQVESSEAGPLIQRIVQFRQTDLDLLIETAERCGLYFTLRGSTLHLCTLTGIGETLPLTLGESLLEARIEVNGHHAQQSVTALGWDPGRVEGHSGKADAARSSHRIGKTVTPQQVGASGSRTLTDIALQDDRQAEALAQGYLDLRKAQEVTLWGVADGNPRLRPATPVMVRGAATSLNGQYALTSVNHSIDPRRGFISQISTAPPVLQGTDSGALAIWGVVIRVDDPEKLGRVQVTLPAFGDLETGWVGVLSAGAGAKKGLVMMPDIGDSVLLVSPHGDPAQSVVIGGLYGAQGLPGDRLRDGGRPFTLTTAGGQNLTLDDHEQSLRLENADGSFIDLKRGKVMLHAVADLEIEAPGKSIVIRGEKIDFQRG